MRKRIPGNNISSGSGNPIQRVSTVKSFAGHRTTGPRVAEVVSQSDGEIERGPA